jgi:quercetin dioxygenase-like cupin family protein
MYDQTCNANDVAWIETELPGAEYKLLSSDEKTGAHLTLYRFAPGCVIPKHFHTDAAETAYVLEGDFIEGDITYGPGQSFYAAAGVSHGPHRTVKGSLVLIQLSAVLDFNPV